MNNKVEQAFKTKPESKNQKTFNTFECPENFFRVLTTLPPGFSLEKSSTGTHVV